MITVRIYDTSLRSALLCGYKKFYLSLEMIFLKEILEEDKKQEQPLFLKVADDFILNNADNFSHMLFLP